jgi:hypothetical protein
MYLIEHSSKSCYQLIFSKPIAKTKFSRVIKELNDICVNIKTINAISNNDEWISISQSHHEYNIIAKFNTTYNDLYWTIRYIRAKVVKNYELLKHAQSSLQYTVDCLNTLESAAQRGLVSNYTSIKRKFTSRRIVQQNKISKKQHLYDCAYTIKYIYLIIIETLANCSAIIDSNVLTNIKLFKIDEYINSFNIDLTSENGFLE